MEVIFISKEIIGNPLVAEIVRIGKKIGKKGTISARFGNRILITASYNLKNLKEDDFVEVVDYNILSDTAVVIGPKEPSAALPLHWMIYRLPKVNTVVHLHGKNINEELTNLDKIMKVTKSLKDAEHVDDDVFGKIYVGFSFNKMEGLF